MLQMCLKCGERISTKWLFLGLPWSTYTCGRCGSVFAGTHLRLLLTSIAVGVVGYVLIAAIKGRMSPAVLVAPALVSLALFLLRLPWQIREVK